MSRSIRYTSNATGNTRNLELDTATIKEIQLVLFGEYVIPKKHKDILELTLINKLKER